MLMTTVVIAPVAVQPASAGGAQLSVVEKVVAPNTTAVTPAGPGTLFSYTISYDCSSIIQGTDCNGQIISDTLPTFTDIYGNFSQLAFDSASYLFPDDFVFNGVSGTAPTQTVSWTGTPNLVRGDAGGITLKLLVPPGLVPFTPNAQMVSNTATVATACTPGGGVFCSAGPAESYINAQPPLSNITKSGPSTALLNAAGTDNISHTISLCPQPGSPLWQNYTVTDTLPPGVSVVEPLPFGGVFTAGTPSTSVPGPPPVITPGTGGTIVWNLTPEKKPPVTAQGCLPITFLVNYKNAFAGGDLTNVIGNTKTNSVSAVGSGPSGAPQNIGPATTTLTLIGPVTRFGPAKNTGGNYYVKDGENVTYNLGATNSSDAEATPFSTATLSDGPFPAGFSLNTINTGTWTGAVATVTATIETSTSATCATWSAPTNVAPGATIAAPGVTCVRWVFTSVGADAIGAVWAASGQQLVGVVNGAPADPGTVLTNCVGLTGVQSGVTQDRGSACADVKLETPKPHPSIAKSSSAASVEPGKTITYTLTAANNIDATGDLVNPQITDCVPNSAKLTVGNVVLGAGWTLEVGPITPITPITPCTPTLPNVAGSGTLLQFQYTGTLTPNQSAPVVTYDVTADALDFPLALDTPTPPGTFTNTASITKADGGSFLHCVQPNCQASKTVIVPVTVQLESNKLVRGALDVDFNIAGTTTPGGQVTWKLTVKNIGNTSVEKVQYVDVFGFVGDTGVRVATKRGSEFAPFLVGPISAPADWTVEYSLSSNPCRPEVLGPNSSCDAPGWTTTPVLASLPLYKAIRLTYDPTKRIAIGDSLSFQWDMVSPVFDPTYDTPNTSASPYDQLASCTIPDKTPPYNPAAPNPNTTGPGNSTLIGRTEVASWVDANGDGIQQAGEGGPTCPRTSNSFAYGVNIPADQLNGLGDPGRLGAEPAKVDLHVAAPPRFNSIGNRVWFDYNRDGKQSANLTLEPGIGAVRVDLFTLDQQGAPIYLDTTFTDPNGNYLFEGLPDGKYFVRFYMPDTLGFISPRDVTGVAGDQPLTVNNTDDDSDIPETPSGSLPAIGNFYDTTTVTLGNDPGATAENDPTWDAGIWIIQPKIDLIKYVNGQDANSVPGPNIPKGAPVTWTYVITNTGDTYLSTVTLTDLVTISGQSAPVPVCNWALSSDPLTPAGVLSRGETVTCTATGTAITGQYGNNATVVGTTVQDDGSTPITGKTGVPPTVTDTDPAHYFGQEYDLALAKIATATTVNQGGSVTWTIRVKNQGNVASGVYTITDTIPAGMSYVSSTSPAPPTNLNRAYSFVMPNLAPGATTEFTITTKVDDITKRPFRNWAEISADSALSLYNTTDFDSTPDTNTGDDSGAGVGTNPNDKVVDNVLADVEIDTVPNDEDDNDLAEVAGTVAYDLALVKTVSPASLALMPYDGVATWTITVKNQGDVDSKGYTVTDNLPAGLSFEGAVPSPSGSAGRTYTWTMPNLAPGATTTIVVTTKVTDQSKKAFVNWAEISSDGSSFYSIAGDTVTDGDSVPDANLGDDPGAGPGAGATNDLNVDRLLNTDVNTDLGATDEDDNDQAVLDSGVLYDLALVKTVAAPTVAYDGTVTWTITVKNQGTVASKKFTVTDTIPLGLAVLGGTPATSNVGQVYNWDISDLAPGATTTITVTTTISDITKRPFRNWAEISADSAAAYGTVDVDSTPDTNTGNDNQAGNNYGSTPNDLVVDRLLNTDVNTDLGATDEDDNDFAEVSVPVTYDLALAKTVSSTTVAQDGIVTFTIVVRNQGNVPSRSFVVTDQLPAGMTRQAAGSTAFTTNPSTNVFTYTIPDLAPGATSTILVNAKATDLKFRPFRNFAEISSDSASYYSIPGSPAVTDVDSTPDADTTNDGNYPALVALPVAPNGSTSDNLGIGAQTDTTAGFAGVSPDTEDDADIADVGSNVIFDLALAKVAETPFAKAGDRPTWRIRVYNQGNVRSGALQVKDALPTGLTFFQGDVFTSAGPAYVGATCNSLTVTCSIPNIEAGDYVDIVIKSTIDGNDLSTAPWRNWAEISSDSAQLLYGVNDIDSVPDGNTGSDNTVPNDLYLPVDANNTLGTSYDGPVGGEDKTKDQDDNDDAVITNSGVYDLALAKTVNSNVILATDSITYTITIRNQGNLDSGVYNVTDKFPVGLIATGVDGGTFNSIDRTITWINLPNLKPGQLKTLTITANIDGMTGLNQRPYRNYAEISQDSAQLLYSINDIDSVPDTNTANDGAYPSLVELPAVPDGSTSDNFGVAAATDVTPGLAGVAHDALNGDDADIADVGVNVVYDLALAKIVDATDLATKGIETGKATFTITVKNQGTVPSHAFTVTDWVPAGIEPLLPIANSGSWNSTLRTITWTMPDMLPGAQLDRSYVVTISDITQRPYRNIAEISADSAGDYSTSTITVKDKDSTPDLNNGNDGTYPSLLSPPGTGIDNLTIDDAGVRNSDPQDDADIADLTYPVIYDLALAKVVDKNVVKYNDTITFTITAQNQGNVDSKQFVITDTVPAGLAPVLPIPNSGVYDAGAGTITWTIGNLNGSPQLNPGESTTVSWQATISDISKRPFRNFAEISADGADNYDAPLINIEDVDSIPDAITTNDGTYPALIELPIGPSGIDNAGIDDAGVGADAPPIVVDPASGGQDDADIADVGVDVVYDLALAKVATVNSSTNTSSIKYDDTITYTITVENQGTVPSRDFVVTDTVPAGIAPVLPIGNGGVYDSGAGTITWTVNLLPGIKTDRTWTATISDLTLRPYRNFAEISADGADFYDVAARTGFAGINVEDIDSIPDSNTGNDGAYPVLVEHPVQGNGIDNLVIGSAGMGADAQTGAPGSPVDGPQDDADIADVGADVVYDLALAKTVSATTMLPDGSVVFTVTVKNQGTVPSGLYTITDNLPVGMAASAASDGGSTATAGKVIWTNMTSLVPGASKAFTFTATITDITKRPFKNIAEISADGADAYDVPSRLDFPTVIDIEDIDSIPDAVTDNDNGDVEGDGYGTYEHPTNDIVNPDAVVPNGEDDADVAFVDAPVLYDLALVKVGPATIQANGTATFDILVKNQGNVSSGNYTITDWVPVGLQAISATDGGLTLPSTTTVTWNLSDLAAGATRTVSVTMKIIDLAKRPWMNYSEISSDGADIYDSPGYETPVAGDVEDDDSTPNTNPSDDVLVDQTELPTTQHNDPAVDEDDHDIAPISAVVDYDLALVKILPAGQSFKQGSNIIFTVAVKNQGNVDSGAITIQDLIPAGMSFVSADSGGLFAGQRVTWEISNLVPNEIRQLSLTLRLDDVTKDSYTNYAEIVSDGSGAYSIPGEVVKDADSTPDTDMTNDLLVFNDDVNIDSLPGDEDDHDTAILDTDKVRVDNPLPPPAEIPATGGNALPLVYGGASLLGIGALALMATRRRRRSVA